MAAREDNGDHGDLSDDELDELLDDVLLDFDKKPSKAAAKRSKDKHSARTEQEEEGPTSVASDLADASEAMKRYLQGQSGPAHLGLPTSTPPNSFVEPSAFSREFERHLKDLRGGGEGKAEAGADALGDALKMLNADSASLSSGAAGAGTSASAGPASEADLEKMFAEMNVNLTSASSSLDHDLMPMMETMMKSLLSKELLYPALRDLADRYPDWLAEHRPELPPAEFDRYNKQFEISRQICEEFDKSGGGDDSENQSKTRQFERVMALMQQMQALGNPPKELAGDAANLPMPPGLGQFEFDAEGNPVLPDGLPGLPPDQCKTS